MTTDREIPAPAAAAPAESGPDRAEAGARLAELAARANLGALDALMAVAKHAGAAPGRNAEAATAARRLSRRMTTGLAQFRIATAPR